MRAVVLFAIVAATLQVQASRDRQVVPGEPFFVVGQTYTATARFSQPLSTNHRCEGPSPSRYDSEFTNAIRFDEGSWAGFKAYELAAVEAMNACKIDYNSDCKIVAASYREIMSREFIGYKACEATVSIHGYRLN